MAHSFRHRTRVLTISKLLWGLVRGLIWLPLWLLGLAILALGLALSPWGAGILLDQGQQRGWFQYEHAEGAPLDRLELEDFQIAVGPTDVFIERFVLDWADDCVLSGRLCIDDLVAEGVKIRLASGNNEAGQRERDPAEPFTFSFPFPVEIRSLLLDDVDIRLANGTHLSWDHLSTGARGEGDSLYLAHTLWAGGRLTLPTSTGVSLALSPDSLGEAEEGQRQAFISADAIDASIAAQSPLPAVAAAQLQDLETTPRNERERLELPELRLPLAIEVPSLLVEDFRLGGPFEYGVERLALTLEGREHDVRIDPLSITTTDADAELTAHVELRDDYPVDARLTSTLRLPELMPELAGERIELEANGSLADLAVALVTEGPVGLTLTGRVDALDPTLPFTATLRGEELAWPLPGATEAGEREENEEEVDPYRVRDLEARIEGDLLGYRAALSAQASGPQVPETRVALTGTGDQQHFAWSPVSLALEQGSLISHGEIRWVEGLAVRAGVRLSNVDPGLFTDAVAGRLSGNVEFSFTQDAQGWQVRVPELGIQGELQDLPIRLDAQLAGNSEMEWQVDRLDFRQGDNRLRAQGQVGDRMDLRGDLQAPALAALSPDLDGMLRGEFTVGGTMQTPQVALDLVGEELRFIDNRLERLNIQARTRGIDDPKLDVRLDAERLNAAGQRFSELALTLDGRLSSHRLTFDAQAGRGMPLSRVEMAIEGGLNVDRNRYRGQLTPLEVDSDYGEIRLASPVNFAADLDTPSITVQPFCLRREQGGEACLEDTLQASASQGRAVLALRDLPMEMLEEALPEEWDVAGSTGAEIVASWRRGGEQWTLDAQLDSRLSLRGLDAYGQPWELPESQIALAVDANQSRAEADLAISLAEAGEIGLELGIDDPMNRGDLEGRLSVDDIRLSPYRTLVTGMEHLRGSISGDVAISGDLQAPTLDGEIRLVGLQARGGDIPVEVRDGEFGIQLEGDRGTIDGFVAAEEGRVDIDGDAAWPTTEEWEITLSIDGREEPVLVVMPDFGRLRVAPDLQIAIDPSLLQVRGRVEVPWARLEIGQTSASAITPSSDEVIISRRDEMRAQREAERAAERAGEGVDESTAEALASAGMALDVQIDLVLGPDMLLEAYGLEAGLRGNLEVRQRSGPVQLFGDVNLTDGRFQAFGQDLLIRQGQLLFSGPPDQPLLQFEAIRNPNVTADDVIAGLRVSGSADAPNLEVFSEPAMEEARALSYLLRGRPPEDGDADGALASALIGLSLSRTGNAVGQLGQAFGIDDLSLETAGTGDESQVVVSGYLFDDLRVSYGVGIFSPIAELTLRYTLWRNLYLQAVSGAAQAVDLIYSFSLGSAEQRREP